MNESHHWSLRDAPDVVAVAAALIFAPLAGGTFAAVDDTAQHHSRFSAEDRAKIANGNAKRLLKL